MSITQTKGIITDKISESTAGAGVTIDGVLNKDGSVILNQGGIKSKSGTLTLAHDTNGVIWTLTDYGRYEVTAYLQGVNDAAYYGAFATVIAIGFGTAAGLRIVTNNTSGTIIRLNGANIEVKQMSGASQTITYTVLKIG